MAKKVFTDESLSTFVDEIKAYSDGAVSTKADKSQGVFYIEGGGTTDTTNKVATWTGSHSDITAYYDGLMIAYKVGTAGSTTTTLNINNLGAVTVVKNVTSAISTSYAVNSIVFLIYTTDSSGTSYWKTADYDANTRNTVGDYRKNGTKLYFVGSASSDSTTSSSYATSYTNSNIYVTTGNVLYSTQGFEGDLAGNATTASSADTATTLTGLTATVAELNKLDGVTATTAELNYVDGVTSNIQTQLDTKAATSDLGFVRVVSCSSSDGVAYTGTTDGITALTAGLTIVFIPSKTSASTSPTLNINGLGAKSIKRRLSHLSTSVQSGYANTWLFANRPFLLVYDGTQWVVDGLTKPSAADLYGTPAAATKATQDGDGNVITTTYATKAELEASTAYQAAVNGGYAGSESEFNAKLAELMGYEVGDIAGNVDSDNTITISGDLADGIYTLKYLNSDGTTTDIGTLNVGNVAAYTNLFNPDTATLNQRWSNSSYAFTTSSGAGYVVSDYIAVPAISSDTNNPTLLRFRGGTWAGSASIIYYNSSKSVIQATNQSDGYGVGAQPSKESAQTDSNGDTCVRLGYRGTIDTKWTDGAAAYIRVTLQINSSATAITSSDIQDIIITIDEEIAD